MTAQAVIITVTFNSSEDLARHWAGAENLGARWIVVDNASSDDSAQVAEGLGAQVVRLPRNVGFSAANNVGAALAEEEECLIFLNPDVRAAPGGVRELTRLALDRGAVVAPQLTNSDGSDQENGRRAPYLFRKFLHFSNSRGSREQYEVTAVPGEVKRIAWAIGAAIAVPRRVFIAMGGWDSHFFVYYEDSDFCLRAHAANTPVLLTGDVRWVHGWARATRRSFSLRAWKLEAASALKFYARYPALLAHPKVLPRRHAMRTVDQPGSAST